MPSRPLCFSGRDKVYHRPHESSATRDMGPVRPLEHDGRGDLADYAGDKSDDEDGETEPPQGF